MNPYEKCPVYENEKYCLRLVEASDAADLLLVYSDEKALPYFNSDNCSGDFHCTLLEQVQGMIGAWLWEYQGKGFVRWTIIDKTIHHAIGTIELFNRSSEEDYFDNCGILRLDLRSDYEREEEIFKILSFIVSPAFELFDCRMIATKVPQSASQRKKAIERLGFAATEEKLIGYHDRKIYSDYYVLQK